MQLETNAERFERIAEARTQAVLDKIKLLGQCSNKNNYTYDSDQVNQIFRAIETEIRKIKTSFTDSNRGAKFTLKK